MSADQSKIAFAAAAIARQRAAVDTEDITSSTDAVDATRDSVDLPSSADAIDADSDAVGANRDDESMTKARPALVSLMYSAYSFGTWAVASVSGSNDSCTIEPSETTTPNTDSNVTQTCRTQEETLEEGDGIATPLSSAEWQTVEREEAWESEEAICRSRHSMQQDVRRQLLAQEASTVQEAKGSVHEAALQVHAWTTERNILSRAERQAVLMRCRIPGTSVKISKISKTDPAFVITCSPHGYCTGQQVIISGVHGGTDAWAVTMNDSHMITVLGEMRFALVGVSSLELVGEANTIEASVASSVMAWDVGNTCSLHMALFSSIGTLEPVLEAGRTLHKVLQRSSNSIMTAVRNSADSVETKAREDADTGNLVPVQSPSAQSMSNWNWLEKIYDLLGYCASDVKAFGKFAWKRTVDNTQPDYWARSKNSFWCMVCSEPFAKPSEDGPTKRVAKHHCRHCGHVVCRECSGFKEPIPWRGYYDSQRVCKDCIDIVRKRNIVLRSYQELWKELHDIPHTDHMLQRAVLQVKSGDPEAKAAPKKGKGKGKPPPPPPPSSKASASSKVKPGSRQKVRDDVAEVVGHRTRKSSDFEDYDLLEEYINVLLRTPATSSSDHLDRGESQGKTLLNPKEAMAWNIARRKYEVHLDDIACCLNQVSLSERSDEWLDILEQVLPLEDKLSDSTLQSLLRAKDSPEELASLRICDQQICTHFLTIPQLQQRFRALCLLRRLETDYLKIVEDINAARRAYEAPLSSTSDAKLRKEPEDFLGKLMSFRAVSCIDISGLSRLCHSEKGRKIFQDIFQPESVLGAQLNGRAFLQCLESAFLGESSRAAAEMSETVKRLLELDSDLQSISKAFAASEDEHLKAFAEAPRQKLDNLLRECSSAMQIGMSLLQALKDVEPKITPSRPSFAPKKPLDISHAQELDRFVSCLRNITSSLRSACTQVEKSNEQSRPARKWNGRRSRHTERDQPASETKEEHVPSSPSELMVSPHVQVEDSCECEASTMIEDASPNSGPPEESCLPFASAEEMESDNSSCCSFEEAVECPGVNVAPTRVARAFRNSSEEHL